MKKFILLFFYIISYSTNYNIGLYIWSKTFNKLSIKTIINEENKYHINYTILSVSNHINIKKLKLFINNNSTMLLIGNNKWIVDTHSIQKKFHFLSKFKTYNLNLDIEPYTINYLKNNKKEYLKMYLNMLKYIKHYYPQYKINISIPTFYKINYIKKLLKYTNKIYIMAYTYKNINQLIKKINYYKIFKNKIVVVFNAKRFKSKNQLFQQIKTFSNKSNYKDIAIHSLKYFNALQ